MVHNAIILGDMSSVVSTIWDYATAGVVHDFLNLVWGWFLSLVHLFFDPTVLGTVAVSCLKAIFALVELVTPSSISTPLATAGAFLSSAEVAAFGRLACWFVDQLIPVSELTAAASCYIAMWPVFFAVKLVLLIVHHFWPGGQA